MFVSAYSHHSCNIIEHFCEHFFSIIFVSLNKNVYIKKKVMINTFGLYTNVPEFLQNQVSLNIAAQWSSGMIHA